MLFALANSQCVRTVAVAVLPWRLQVAMYLPPWLGGKRGRAVSQIADLFGENLACLRERAELSQEEMASAPRCTEPRSPSLSADCAFLVSTRS